MNFFEQAKRLADMGFHVFPLVANRKIPTGFMAGYPERATRDHKQIEEWWLDPVLELVQPYNIGISTTHYADGEALVVVDVDNKDPKCGDATLLDLELEGKHFPHTYFQVTPTGGRHLLYRVPKALKQGVDVLGEGLDTRSRGGYIVAAGSLVPAGEYTAACTLDIVDAPTWLVDACGQAPDRPAADHVNVLSGLSLELAIERATHYLQYDAPESIKGQGGDHTAYKVAARVKDLGVDPDTCLELMLQCWFNGSGWTPEKLWRKVQHAYRYGQEAVGSDAPEASFGKIEANDLDGKGHPILELNKEFAFVVAGGGHHIIWETIDPKGMPIVEHLNEGTFHKLHAARTMTVGRKTKPLTQWWIEDHRRRTYRGICFAPEKEAPKGYYNLWTGFTVEPFGKDEEPSAEAVKAFAAWKQHALFNVCDGDEALYDWLMIWFAQLIQRPWEKPLTALVMKGEKGVGKNVLFGCVGDLLGPHYKVTAKKRMLLGDFNAHLERALLFVLDEAFWSGDKAAEGILKDLVTGNTHTIERKGLEVYDVDNLTRVVVIGNENWLVPASHDERRYAVFNVGNDRKQDVPFFRAMRRGMKAGGNRLLMEFLQGIDISNEEYNVAPNTKGLLDQKLGSLGPAEQWWNDCLMEGSLLGADDFRRWPDEISTEMLRQAQSRYSRERGVRSWSLSAAEFGKTMAYIAPALKKARKSGEDGRYYVYALPELDSCRQDWEARMGHGIEWE